MANCSSGGCGTTPSEAGAVEAKGCQNNGTCGTSGCNKMNVFDWLSQMDIPSEYIFDVVEVKFKGGRKEFYRNVTRIDLNTGDYVVIDAQKGWHIGTVSLQGELVRLQMKKYKVKDSPELPHILRKAEEKDTIRYEQANNREMSTLYRTREIIKELNLNMKLSDIEFQADNTKATFFYSADSRVDFRELIKLLAAEFRIRVEMKQISIRQEAGRIGGIGACGRELCCSTWLSEFKSVSTSAARYQNLSLNPTKLSGQCGRLKCCLNYELETYLEALRDIPKIEDNIITLDGEAKLQKTDIFRRILWFSYDTENNWYAIPVDEVLAMIAQNKKGIVLPPLSEEFWLKEKTFKVEIEPPIVLKDRNRNPKNANIKKENSPVELPLDKRKGKNAKNQPAPKAANPARTGKVQAEPNAKIEKIETTATVAAQNVKTENAVKKPHFKNKPPRKENDQNMTHLPKENVIEPTQNKEVKDVLPNEAAAGENKKNFFKKRRRFKKPKESGGGGAEA